MYELKEYQKRTLGALRAYLEMARTEGPAAAFDAIARADNPRLPKYKTVNGFDDIPYVCLRLPTGGGKTLLASHSIEIAARCWLEQDYPVVLWLVPTNTIRNQTLEALKHPGHYYRQAIDNAFDGRVSVFDINDVNQIRPQDLTAKVCVIVGTLATLRIDKTEGRRVYDYNENFEAHFAHVPDNEPGLERIEDGPDKGKIKFSFANLLHLHKPLVIMDEAHNARTSLTFETLQRISPACIIEFTATPLTEIHGSNVLYQVSASELKAEDMIKLPIMLTEHKNWHEALTATIMTRQKLADVARKDSDFVRPIALIQAENKDREVTVDVIRNHLIENERIAPERIAVATGSQRELDNVDLFDPACKIEYIITVEALKEGWDCSFAYVFCSVANIHSSRDVEQILGRVLRMPYARKRPLEELNKAYAHVASPSFAEAAVALHDRLVDMGFEEEEANSFIMQEELPLPQDSGNLPLFAQEKVEALTFLVSTIPDVSYMGDLEKEKISVIEDDSGKTRVVITGEITEHEEERLVNSLPKDERENARKEIRAYRFHRRRRLWPSERGETLMVPRLCIMVQGELEIAEKELFLDEKGWTLLDYPYEFGPTQLSFDEKARTFEIDVNDKKVVYSLVDNTKMLDLSHISISWTDMQLSRWLDKEVRQQDVKQEVMLEFIRRAVSYLVSVRNLDLADLVRNKYILAKFFRERIKQYRQQAYNSGYQATLFGPNARVNTSYVYAFCFDNHNYPANRFYDGSYVFKNHFYAIVGAFDNEEEFECARALDSLPKVKHWVRNVTHPRYSFWLPTSTDRFYPDLVAELDDGRIFVVEYKGKVYLTTDDSQEKRNLGELWEEKSRGKALFLMAEKRDVQGRDVYKQLADKIKQG
ncbi:MAG: restriction endonuclease subunit R [Syntrophus sp. (in: bacteria)]|nr:restriction endonuclease subunit R [Syntrophus sp. (in: bacteria)]